MSGWRKIFVFIAGEDIRGDDMNLGVTMLARLGGTHLLNLARTVLDKNMSIFPQGGALHWISQRSSSIGTLESVFMLEVYKSAFK